MFKRKGSTELVSIVLGIVIIGALALAIAGSFSKQTKTSLDSGLTQQTTQLGTNYKDAATVRNATAPTLQ